MPKRYVFPGDVPFLERAARESGHEGPMLDVGAVRKSPAFAEIGRHLTALSGLDPDGQHARDNPAAFRKTAEDFLSRAEAARDRLALALAAADLMIEEAGAAFFEAFTPARSESEPSPADGGGVDADPAAPDDPPVPPEQGTADVPGGERSTELPLHDFGQGQEEWSPDDLGSGKSADEPKPRKRGRPRKHRE